MIIGWRVIRCIGTRLFRYGCTERKRSNKKSETSRRRSTSITFVSLPADTELTCVICRCILAATKRATNSENVRAVQWIIVLIIFILLRTLASISSCYIWSEKKPAAIIQLTELFSFFCVLSAWHIGAVMCKLTPYMQGVAVNASVNTLAAISVDRLQSQSYIRCCYNYYNEWKAKIGNDVGYAST